MPHCSVLGCLHRRIAVSGVMCMRVPGGKNDGERREAWGHALCRDLTSNYNSVRVCELHFTADDWEKVRQDGKRKLKPTAVPSMNLPSTESRIPLTIPSIQFPINNKVILASSSPQVHSGSRLEHSYSSALGSTTPVRPKCSLDSVQDLSSNEPQIQNITNLDTVPSIQFPNKNKVILASSTPLVHSGSRLDHSYSSALTCSPVPLDSTTPVSLKCSLGTVQDFTHYLTREQDLEKELSLMKRTLKEKEEQIMEKDKQIVEQEEKIKQKDKSLDKLSREGFSLRRRLKAERRTNLMLKKRDSLIKENLKSMLTSDQVNALGRKSTRGLKRLDVGIADGLSLKSLLGTTKYNTLSKRFKLPSIRLLQKKSSLKET